MDHKFLRCTNWSLAVSDGVVETIRENKSYLVADWSAAIIGSGLGSADCGNPAVGIGSIPPAGPGNPLPN